MRQFLLVLLGGLLLNTAVFGQLNAPVQIGKATHELQDSGLSAAHFNIPLGSRVKIANAETGKEIEVTIRGRIPLSPHRIVDLSPAARNALDLTVDTDVRLVPPPVPVAGGDSGANRAPAGDNQETGQWFTIQVHPDASPVSSWEIRIIAGDEERQLTIQGRHQGEPAPRITGGDEEPLDADENAEDEDYSALVLTHTPPIKVIPRLPNPNRRKIYRLQVGAYARAETADVSERELQAAGFSTRREAHGSLTRVLAVGIPAAEVKSAVQAIESAGFGEVWVRE
jgi:cell division septation protein DedD